MKSWNRNKHEVLVHKCQDKAWHGKNSVESDLDNLRKKYNVHKLKAAEGGTRPMVLRRYVTIDYLCLGLFRHRQNGGEKSLDINFIPKCAVSRDFLTNFVSFSYLARAFPHIFHLVLFVSQ